MRAALYARVSRADQQTLPEQLAQMREYCARRGWSVDHEFQEQMSGAKDSRPERKALLLLAHQRKIDVIVVWKLDRWGRNFRDLVLTLAELGEKGCAFVSITQNLDFTTPTGKLMVNVLAAFAEFDRDTLIERTKMGIQNARKKGVTLGRRATPELYRREIYELSGKGYKPARIVAEMAALKMKVSEATVRRVLKDGKEWKREEREGV